MSTLEFNIKISAPKQKVWDTMLNAETYKEWVGVSWPGSFYQGEWKEGEEIRFISEDGSGILGLIKVSKPYDQVLCEYIALLGPGGVRDSSSEFAQDWVGVTEQYRFVETNGKTDLKVEITLNPEFEKMFNDGWPNALKKLKEVAEKNEGKQ